jgi:hypothetical protein
MKKEDGVVVMATGEATFRVGQLALLQRPQCELFSPESKSRGHQRSDGSRRLYDHILTLALSYSIF